MGALPETQTGAAHLQMVVDNTEPTAKNVPVSEFQQRWQTAAALREQTTPVATAYEGLPSYKDYQSIAEEIHPYLDGVDSFPADFVGHALASIEQSMGQGVVLGSLSPAEAADAIMDIARRDTVVSSIIVGGRNAAHYAENAESELGAFVFDTNEM